MIVVIGEPRLAGEISRALLARGKDVFSAGVDAAIPSGSTIVLAEGTSRCAADLERALRAIAVGGGDLVWATDRPIDDEAVVAVRRRGVPYTIVRSSGLVDLPAVASRALVLVPSDLGRVPFATSADLARAVVERIAGDGVGTGATIEVGTHVGAAAWARALRDLGARAFVVPRWLAATAGLFGVSRLEPEGGRIVLVRGAQVATARRLAAG